MALWLNSLILLYFVSKEERYSDLVVRTEANSKKRFFRTRHWKTRTFTTTQLEELSSFRRLRFHKEILMIFEIIETQYIEMAEKLLSKQQ